MNTKNTQLLAKHRAPRSRDAAVAVVVLSFALSMPALGQWENVKSPNLPRSRDGKPVLSAPAPRTPDRKPDLSGIWWVPFHGVEGVDAPKYLLNLAADLKPGEVPIQPWADAILKKRMADLAKDFPISRCLPPGVPMVDAIPAPFKIIETPGLVVILYEAFSQHRQIFTDGRAFPKDPNPTWMGYSVGRWEKDALVVESTGFNDKTWLDALGHPHTDALRVTERFQRRDVGHMDIQVTIDDPKAYTRPWTATMGAELVPDTDLLEDVCNENERDVPHLVGR